MKIDKQAISDAEFKRQIEAAKERPVTEPAASSAYYKNGEVHIHLVTGWHFSFPPGRLREFKKATERDLKKIGLAGQYTLSCEPLDVDISIGGILIELVGEKFINRELARRNGSVRTAKKRAASRTNGKLGGRPKKHERKLVS
ncbi:MAG TPA: hypothetical protein DEP46_09600 [Blastocatellia bacterium]|nr:hypothetical protein [Blastocatellia bacterium]